MKKKLMAVLITFFSMVAILAAGLIINRVAQQKREAQWEAERETRILEVNESYENIQAAISEVSQLSTEEIEAYIEENTDVVRTAPVVDASDFTDPWDENEDATEEEMADSENGDWESGSSKENVDRVANLGLKAVREMNSVSGNLVSQNELPDDSAMEGTVSENTVSGNTVSGNTVSGNTVSSNDLSGGHQNDGSDDPTLEERKALRTSYEETHLWIDADEKVLERNPFDFSDKKIVCLGDSITEATNLIEMEGYEQYSYPTRLKEILGAKEMINLGIGGSSLGRYWDKAFCERYQEIPEDADIIIIMGGDNDGYCLHEDMVGGMENREFRTLYGDTDELMRGLAENYPDADIFIMTEMPNLLHDVLRKERPELLPQSVVTDCVSTLAREYGFNLIDNYNSNFLDSHDADIVAEYMPDSVHPNEKGYEIFAKHVAAEMIRIYESQNPDVTYKDPAESTDEEVVDEGAAGEDAEDEEAVNEETEDKEDVAEEATDEDIADEKESNTIIFDRNAVEEVNTADDESKDEDSKDEDSTDGEVNDSAFEKGSKTVVFGRDD